MDDKKYEIYIELNSLQHTSKGLITGVISFSINDDWFPSKQWVDFPVRLLGCWIEEVLAGLSSRRRKLRLLFMDGPYEVQLERISGATWSANYCKRCKSNGAIAHSIPVDIVQIAKCMVETSRRLVHHCKEVGWESTDIKYLENAVGRIALYEEE